MSYGLFAPDSLRYAAVIPFLILLYFLKLRRKRVTISSVLLIDEFVRDERVNTLFQRLHRVLLLLLQVLFLVLVVLALARPYLAVRASAPSDLVVIIDASASMAAEEDGASRLAVARSAALSIVGRLGSQDRAAVIEASTSPRILCEPTGSASRAAAAIAEVEQSHGESALADAVVLAASLKREPDRQRALFLISDGRNTRGSSFAALPQFADNATRLVHVPVGGLGPNLAITAVDARREPFNPYLVQVFLQVRNYGTEDTDVPLTLLLDEAPLAHSTVHVPAGSAAGLLLEEEIADTEEHVLRVELGTGDALAVDDVAHFVLSGEEVVRVLHVSYREGFLDRALATDEKVRVTHVTPDALGLVDLDRYDVVLFDGVPMLLPPDADLAGKGVACLGCPVADPPELVPARLADIIDDAEVVDWAESHPLLRFSGAFDLRMLRLVNATERPGAEVLIRSREGVVASLDDENMTRSLFFAVSADPGDSDFPFRVSFPIFWTRAVRWLGERSAASRTGVYLSASNVRVGDVVRAGGVDDGAVVMGPDGRELPLEPVNGEALYPVIGRTGVYEVRSGDASARFSVNLASRDESNLTVVAVPQATAVAVERMNEAVERPREMWRILGLLALALLLGEWAAYHLWGV